MGKRPPQAQGQLPRVGARENILAKCWLPDFPHHCPHENHPFLSHYRVPSPLVLQTMIHRLGAFHFNLFWCCLCRWKAGAMPARVHEVATTGDFLLLSPCPWGIFYCPPLLLSCSFEAALKWCLSLEKPGLGIAHLDDNRVKPAPFPSLPSYLPAIVWRRSPASCLGNPCSFPRSWIKTTSDLTARFLAQPGTTSQPCIAARSIQLPSMGLFQALFCELKSLQAQHPSLLAGFPRATSTFLTASPHLPAALGQVPSACFLLPSFFHLRPVSLQLTGAAVCLTGRPGLK